MDNRILRQKLDELVSEVHQVIMLPDIFVYDALYAYLYVAENALRSASINSVRYHETANKD